jgi:amino acid adenylation domain-containing protein
VAETSTATLGNVPVSWNEVVAEYPQHKCIHSLFEEQVALTPHEVALEFRNEGVTYTALNSMADQIADVLKCRQFAPGTRVAVAQQRSPQLVAALLGILKAGGVCVPINLSYPDERLRFLLTDASVRYAIGSCDQRSAFAHLGSEIEFIDLKALPPAERRDSSAAITSDSPAYILYTSGSTGVPKGVILCHRSVVRLVRNTNYVTITPDDVFLQLSPFSFDGSIFEIWAPLLNGARLAIAPPGDPSLSEIGDFIDHHQVSILFLTTGLFHAMVDERPRTLARVRQLFAGGDVLSARHAKTALSAMESGCVINGYGPTESTTFTCCFRVTRDTPIDESVPIGKPIANTSVYILDPELRPVPIGQIGEIFIGGDGLALGYLNRPDLEREKFVANPFASEGDARLYRSGDLGFFTASGDIEFCGRIDNQAKVRGFRIEPGEIEAAAMRLQQIRQAFVVTVQNHFGDNVLVCHYVPVPGWDVPQEALRAYLSAVLPAYMVPTQYRRWDMLPLTVNGKVDRRKLVDASTASQPAVAPKSEGLGAIERALSKIFRQLLDRDDISVDDDFFVNGGDSLAAARLFAQIEEQFDKRLPLVTLFEAPTIRQLATVLRDEEWSPNWSPLVPIRANGTRRPLFLVHAIGGNVLNYKRLDAHIAADQPIYALQAAGLQDRRMDTTTIEEVAHTYLAALRSAQPEGPYYLGGFSAGGVVAYEMAQQLVRAGQNVAILLLFDSSIELSATALLRLRRFDRAALRVARAFWWNLGYLMRTDPRSFVKRKAHNFMMNLRIMRYQIQKACANVLGLSAPASFLTVEEVFIRALEDYVPKPYGGRAVLFQTKDSDSYNPDNACTWNTIIRRGLNVVDVVGDHESMFEEPQAKALANAIANYLDDGASEAGDPAPTSIT